MRDVRIDELDAVAAHLSRLVVRRERELDELRGQVDEVLVRARGYATRVRMQALRQAATIAGSAANGNRGANGGNGRRSEPASGAGPDPAGESASTPEAAREHAAAADTVAEAPQSTFGVRPAAPLDLCEGIVQLEIGPLSDFSQLVGFEDAAGTIEAMKEVSITRFSQGRATLDLRLDQPVDLLRELEQRAPFEFKVRSLRDGRLILDLDDEAKTA